MASLRKAGGAVTLDDLERRNSPNRRVVSPNSVAFEADYVKVRRQYFLQRKCRPQNVVFSDKSFMAIFAGDHPQRER